MPYYLRLFSKRRRPISLSQLQGCLPNGVRAELQSGQPSEWEAVLLLGRHAERVGLLERANDELVPEEVDEFIDELNDARPANGARWVADYLREVTQLISCQVFEAGFGKTYGGTPGLVLWNLKGLLGDGIIQSEGEGFTNLDGYQVVWQFSENAAGPWAMAVLTDVGRWIAFEIELGDPGQRSVFLDGRVPANARILDR